MMVAQQNSDVVMQPENPVLRDPSSMVSRLAERLQVDFPSVDAPTDRIWSASPAEKILDCVLSLHRHYDAVVVPKVAQFHAQRPTIRSLESLKELITSYSSPAAFLEAELDVHDSARAAIVAHLVDYLLEVSRRFSGGSEEERLLEWARDARPGDYLGANIKGFALAGWQYLRMLHGAEATKPDVHVIRYVSEAVGQQVSAAQALYLLEAAAAENEVSLRGLDVAIWNQRARGRPA